MQDRELTQHDQSVPARCCDQLRKRTTNTNILPSSARRANKRGGAPIYKSC